MLRNIFVAGIVIAGVVLAIQSPFYALLFYLWDAYFRPEQWLWTDWISSLQISFIIGSYVLLSLLLGPVRLHFGRRHVLLLLFAVHCIVSMLLSDYLHDTWPFMQEFL